MTLKTSQEWADLFDYDILDPDGWDRRNFERSWTEKITEQEFMHRAMQSTVQPRSRDAKPLWSHHV